MVGILGERCEFGEYFTMWSGCSEGDQGVVKAFNSREDAEKYLIDNKLCIGYSPEGEPKYFNTFVLKFRRAGENNYRYIITIVPHLEAVRAEERHVYGPFESFEEAAVFIKKAVRKIT